MKCCKESHRQFNHPAELVISFEGLDMRNNLHLLQKPQYVLDLSGEEISFETLSQLRDAAPFIYSLDLCETVLTNAGLEILSKFNFRNLRQLNLSGNRFDDDGMPFLSGLTSVNNLKIAYNKISATGLRALLPLPLEYLDAGCTYLENDGIRLIPDILPKLKELDVRASGFDEVVLDSFLELSQLQKLNVTRTKISPPALESFLAKTQKRTIQVQADNLLQ